MKIKCFHLFLRLTRTADKMELMEEDLDHMFEIIAYRKKSKEFYPDLSLLFQIYETRDTVANSKMNPKEKVQLQQTDLEDMSPEEAKLKQKTIHDQFYSKLNLLKNEVAQHKLMPRGCDKIPWVQRRTSTLSQSSIILCRIFVRIFFFQELPIGWFANWFEGSRPADRHIERIEVNF